MPRTNVTLTCVCPLDGAFEQNSARSRVSAAQMQGCLTEDGLSDRSEQMPGEPELHGKAVWQARLSPHEANLPAECRGAPHSVARWRRLIQLPSVARLRRVQTL